MTQTEEETRLLGERSRNLPAPQHNARETGNEAPSERKSLVFLQMNTPLSILFCIMAAVFGALVVPSVEKAFRIHETYFTPSPKMFFLYLVAMYVSQIGFCSLSIFSPSAHTKRMIVRSTGSRLALENYLLSLWFVLRILDTIWTTALAFYVLAVIAILAIVNDVKLYFQYPSQWSHPLEMLFVHVPNKLMTVLITHQLFWQQLFMAFGWTRSQYVDNVQPSLWLAVVVTALMGILVAVWVGFTGDIGVYLATMFLDISVFSFYKMPVIGPRSRPFVLTVFMLISMTLRTIALLVPGLISHGFVVVCHGHRGGPIVDLGAENVHDDAPAPVEPNASDVPAQIVVQNPDVPKRTARSYGTLGEDPYA
ncbi:hypothetical protein MVES_001904 [Malassezia vespertilionis]|uniref:Uncharacterized protein n=1 Tax=Malassezia vespertilionis TaxID=2020962 RepID=A0A2N1JBV9_9BASI|nr:hypothetical protein MVES_001904 [Malassezia vespertilionis]